MHLYDLIQSFGTNVKNQSFDLALGGFTVILPQFTNENQSLWFLPRALADHHGGDGDDGNRPRLFPAGGKPSGAKQRRLPARAFQRPRLGAHRDRPAASHGRSRSARDHAGGHVRTRGESALRKQRAGDTPHRRSRGHLQSVGAHAGAGRAPETLPDRSLGDRRREQQQSPRLERERSARHPALPRLALFADDGAARRRRDSRSGDPAQLRAQPKLL